MNRAGGCLSPVWPWECCLSLQGRGTAGTPIVGTQVTLCDMGWGWDGVGSLDIGSMPTGATPEQERNKACPGESYFVGCLMDVPGECDKTPRGSSSGTRA